MTIVFMFPGQSSRYPAMIERLVRLDGACAAVVDHASNLVGRDLATHYRADNPAALLDNRDVQLGVFLANHLHLTALEGAGVRASWSLGLSLGEYNHLVHIGALGFDDAIRLVQARGALYQGAQGGLMVSVFPVGPGVVHDAIAALGIGDRVGVGLYNSPTQQVVSGERSAVEALVGTLESEHLVDAVVIEPRIPMHAPVFAPTGVRLAKILAGIPFAVPGLAYVPNVRGEPVGPATGEVVRACLTEHVFRPVRWRDSIDAVAAHVPDPHFIEVGPGRVLCNLFRRDWRPGVCHHTDDVDGWPTNLAMLATELRHAI
jgi:[acyl-carrier-protein] S-malonyltransferase